ncbi:MAG: 30S ribosomal protein S16 [Candidatus Scalindua sp.]|jgi:small subunit ribosomal protein S16|nr:30S ribosomal protein S16 [Candidatus Scalindua sp.]MBT5303613.1 30S ribosomal protein S16 [Candidatus Scalindua sp.]MBT6227944.1 30S ribosomal protein S16 [Candidatus Scalindua sp.]MBT7211417.1 30S ribosomal protein S16 [Candidatus Scalindua sp.]MBT7589655.1 30S ribosomal protein S16 [Candidatus Scalindua sp.]
MVRLRLKRMGRRNRAFFRLCAFDAREERDGRSIEQLGTYDPMEKDEEKKVVLKRERIEYWLSVGAQPTETVASILKKNKIGIKS